VTFEEITIRLGTATGIGLALGIDRELRGIAAGMRTHALVALSSALITVSALMLYEDLHSAGGSDIDPLRVVQGLAQAVGLVAAGAIFFARGEIHNLTSAANLWLAAAVGITAGAGQFTLVAVGLGLGIATLTLVRLVEALIPWSLKSERSGEGEEQGNGRSS
jgi:putative Mg2+ transporter-C (MgtC) family protein